jgi:hypothetical protein
MKDFIVTTTDIEQLKKCGTIVFEAKLMPELVIIETLMSREELLKVSGVITAEESRIGGFNLSA